MAFQPVPSTWKHEIFGTTAGVPCVNVIHTDQFGGNDVAAALAAAQELRALYVTNILPQKVAGFMLGEVVTTDLGVEGGAQAVATGSDRGTMAGTASTSQMCAVVQLLTAIRGRSFRGRIFDCGYVREIFGSDGTISDANRANIGGAWQTMANQSAAAASGAFVVVSRTHNKIVRPEGIREVVSSINCARLSGVQRRRHAA